MNYRPSRSFATLLLATVCLLTSCSREKVETSPKPGKNDGSAIKVSADADAAEPAIAADKEGNTFVVFVEHGGKASADVYLQKYKKGLEPSGAKVRVSSDGSAKTWRGDPPTVAVGPDGTVYVGWTRALAVGKGTDLVISTSSDGGQTFDLPVKVNDDTKPASHGMHSLAVGTDGRVYVAWLDERNVKTSPHMASVTGHENDSALPDGFEFVEAHHTDKSDPEPTPTPKPAAEESEPNSEVFFSFSDDGGKTFAPNKKVAADVCPCCKTSMLAASDGKVYVSWRQVLPGDLRHIAVASTADKGESFSQRTIVSDDQWKINACPVSGAAMLNGANNVLTVVWYTAGDAGPAGLYMASSIDGGKTFGSRLAVKAEGAVSGMPVAFKASGPMICLFGASDDRIKTRGVGDFPSQIVIDVGETIDNASSPAGTIVDGKIYTAFVRTAGDTRSVWLSPIH